MRYLTGGVIYTHYTMQKYLLYTKGIVRAFSTVQYTAVKHILSTMPNLYTMFSHIFTACNNYKTMLPNTKLDAILFPDYTT